MRRVSIYLIAVICVCNNILFCSCSGINVTGSQYVDENLIISFKTIYSYVDNYVQKNIGKNYKLYQLKGKYLYDKNEYIEFVYTKRNKKFNDVYFIKFYSEEKKLVVARQAEAERLYGGDTIINPGLWQIDIDDIPKIKDNKDIVYTSIEFYTAKDNIIVIHYMYKDEIIYTIDFSIVYNKVISSY